MKIRNWNNDFWSRFTRAFMHFRRWLNSGKLIAIQTQISTILYKYTIVPIYERPRSASGILLVQIAYVDGFVIIFCFVSRNGRKCRRITYQSTTKPRPLVLIGPRWYPKSVCGCLLGLDDDCSNISLWCPRRRLEKYEQCFLMSKKKSSHLSRNGWIRALFLPRPQPDAINIHVSLKLVSATTGARPRKKIFADEFEWRSTQNKNNTDFWD